jgi:hypothetical protein
MDKEMEGFEGWAIVELFGRNQIAGYVSDVPQFGTSMMRVDVSSIGDNPGYTKFFGSAAIYAITPTTEEIAKAAARRLDIRPVADWIIPDRPQLPGPYRPEITEYLSEQEDYQDEDPHFFGDTPFVDGDDNA